MLSKSEKKQLPEMYFNCPNGYKVAVPGQAIDMIGAKEMWLIHSNHSEPYLVRIPEDLVDYGNGLGVGIHKRPKEWGHPIYYKVV